MNVEKMRRANARRVAEAEGLNRRRWLAGLTPDHRAKHEAYVLPMVCWECVNADLQRAVAALPQSMRRSTQTTERF